MTYDRPDFDDMASAAHDAVRLSGLEQSATGEIWWDDVAGTIGFTAMFALDELDRDYLSPDQTERLNAISADHHHRTIHHVAHGHRHLADYFTQFVSVDLSQDELDAAAAVMVADGEEFAEEALHYWRTGNPAGSDDCFGWSSLRKAWETVETAVVTAVPDVAAVLTFARSLRDDANRTFAADVEYMRSDEWQTDFNGDDVV